MTLITGIIGFNCCHSTITGGFTRKKETTEPNAKKANSIFIGKCVVVRHF